jgi:replicative DNA helicase
MNARTEAEAFAQPDEITRHLRIPPHSAESEMALLGGLLLENRAWDLIADLVVESDFYRFEPRLVFTAISQLVNANRPADVITVWARLQSMGKGEEAGGLAYVNSLAQYVPSAANIRRHAETVRERAVLRNLIAASDEIATSAFNPQGRAVADIADAAEQRILGIIEARGNAADEWESMETLVVRELDRIQVRHDGNDENAAGIIPTGLAAWDDLLDGGLRPGQLVIVGGRPSMGKSALADSVGLHVALHLGLPVGKFSMEMQNAEGAQRALSNAGKVPMHALRRPERMSDVDWSNLSAGVEKLSRVPFYSTDRGGLNINQIRTKARVLKRRHGLRMLIVDYLQLMSGTDTRAPRTYQLEEASRGLKSLAKELGIPVIALVQVSRGVEKEIDPMPKMSDIKDCGAIEQDADIILFIHRPIVVNPDLGEDWRYLANCHMAKQRGGKTGKFDLMYVGKHTRFKDWPADTPIPVVKVVKAKGKGL